MIDRGLKKAVVKSYLLQLATIGCNFAFIGVLTRSAGISEYGAFATPGALGQVFLNFLTFRSNESVTYFARRAESSGPSLGHILLVAGSMDLAVAILATIAVFIGLSHYQALFSGRVDLSGLALAQSLLVSSQVLRGAPAGLMAAKDRFGLLNTLNLIESLLKVAFVALHVLINGSTDSIAASYSCFLAALVPTLVLIVLALKELNFQRPNALIPRESFKEMFRYGGGTFVSTTLKSVSQNIDPVLLGAILRPDELGIYNFARQALAPLNFLVGPFAAQLFPRFVAAESAGDRVSTLRAISRVNSRLFRVSGLLLPCLALGYLSYLIYLGHSVGRPELLVFGFLACTAMLRLSVGWG